MLLLHLEFISSLPNHTIQLLVSTITLFFFIIGTLLYNRSDITPLELIEN